jgi:hypothetical protein
MTKRTLIIAEAGVNHNGDLALARELIVVAAEAGADLIKFQTFSADRLVTRTAGKARYQNRTTDGKESQYEMLHRLELTTEMHKELMAHCAARAASDERSSSHLIRWHANLRERPALRQLTITACRSTRRSDLDLTAPPRVAHQRR